MWMDAREATKVLIKLALNSSDSLGRLDLWELQTSDGVLKEEKNYEVSNYISLVS